MKRLQQSVSTSPSRYFRCTAWMRRPGRYPSADEAPLCAGVLPKTIAGPVGIEARASSHHWSRELMALGHTVRLMPPAYVKPYVKRQKTTLRTRRPSARLSPGQTCGLSRPKTPSSRAAWCSIARAIVHLPADAVINAILPILASSQSSHESDAMVSRTCSMSSPIQATSELPK